MNFVIYDRNPEVNFYVMFLCSIIIITLFLIPLTSYSQKVYSVKYPNQSDVKVYVVEYENQCDLKVFKVD